MPNGEGPKTTTVTIPFAGGMDEKVAEEYLDPTHNQVSIINGNFTKIGAVDKRLGVGHIPNTVEGGSLPAITQASRANSWSKSSMVIATNSGAYTYAQAQEGAIGIGPLPAMKPVRRPLDFATFPTVGDLPYNGRTLRICVGLPEQGNFFGSTTLSAMVYDADSGDLVQAITPLYTDNTYAQLTSVINVIILPDAPVAQSCIVLWVDFGVAGNNVFYSYYNPVTNTFSAYAALGIRAFAISSIIPTGIDATPWWGIGAGNATDHFAVAYSKYSSSGHTIDLAVFDSSATQTNTTLVYTDNSNLVTGPTYIWASRGAGEVSWVLFGFTGNNYWLYQIAAINQSWAVQGGWPRAVYGASTIIFTGVVRADTDSCWITFNDGNTGFGFNGTFERWSQTSALEDFGTTPFMFSPISRPFLANGVLNQVMEFYNGVGSVQYTMYCMALLVTTTPATTSGNRWFPVACVAQRQLYTYLGPTQLNAYHLTLMSGMNGAQTGTRFALGTICIGEQQENPPTWVVDFYCDQDSLSQLYQMNELGGELHISSGVKLVFDGQVVQEDNFFYYPEATGITLGGSGGTLNGTYQYAVVYARIDGAGLIHRSAPFFPPSQQLTTGGQLPTLHIPSYNVSYNDLYTPGTIYAEVYRTTANGTIYYWVNNIPVSNCGTATVTWPVGGGGDTDADNNIIRNAQLYTTPVGQGILPNFGPPAALIQTTNNSRVVIVDETLRQTWETQAFDPIDAPGFNGLLVTQYPEGGDIVGIQPLDSQLVVFKKSSIWLRSGQGPAPSGQGSDWTVPQQLPTGGIGCKDWRSIVLMPNGIMFQAPDNNLYLLGRDLQVTFIGKNVVDTMQLYPTVLSATLVPSAQQVRFLVTDGSLSWAVVYDYLLNQWCKHLYLYLSAPVASSFLTFNAPQIYTIVTKDGQLWQENLPTAAGAYFDQDMSGTNQFVPTVITLPWIKYSGVGNPQNIQKMRYIQFLGVRQDACGLVMSYAVNDIAQAVQNYVFASAQLDTLPNPGQVMVGVAAKDMFQQSLQLTILDTPATTTMVTGQGMRFVNCSFELQGWGQRWGILPAGARQ